MPTYKFELQNCIEIEMDGKDAEEARMKLVDSLSDYADEMVGADAYLSDGEEI